MNPDDPDVNDSIRDRVKAGVKAVFEQLLEETTTEQYPRTVLEQYFGVFLGSPFRDYAHVTAGKRHLGSRT